MFEIIRIEGINKKYFIKISCSKKPKSNLKLNIIGSNVKPAAAGVKLHEKISNYPLPFFLET